MKRAAARLAPALGALALALASSLAAAQPALNQTFLTALANFMYWENYDVRVRMDGKIDRVVLDDIRKNRRPRR